ncbi:MAG: hypothetical protein ACLP1Q_02555 [Solirubrobacteraceae bacterium]
MVAIASPIIYLDSKKTIAGSIGSGSGEHEMRHRADALAALDATPNAAAAPSTDVL